MCQPSGQCSYPDHLALWCPGYFKVFNNLEKPSERKSGYVLQRRPKVLRFLFLNGIFHIMATKHIVIYRVICQMSMEQTIKM